MIRHLRLGDAFFNAFTDLLNLGDLANQMISNLTNQPNHAQKLYKNSLAESMEE